MKKVSLVFILSIIGIVISLFLIFSSTLAMDILKDNAPKTTCMTSIFIGFILGGTSIGGVIYHACNEYWKNR